MSRVKTKGLEPGELVRLVASGTGNEINLCRSGRSYFIKAYSGAYRVGPVALRALARAILREVPAKETEGAVTDHSPCGCEEAERLRRELEVTRGAVRSVADAETRR